MASLLPNGKQSFTDDNGNPLAGGKVYFYIPNTSTKKNTFQDLEQTILNTNPIILDARGEAVIWGTGTYRQVVYDQFDNLIWDQETQGQNADLVGDMQDNVFVPGDGVTPGTFVPGVTTVLTLSGIYGSVSNIWVYFDGVPQLPDQIDSISDFTLTFNSPIPVGVEEVLVKGGSTIPIGTPANGTVTDAKVAQGGKLYNRMRYIFNVVDYGAKLDGVTDDTAAINAAEVAANASGGAILQFPAGTAIVTGVTKLSNTIWQGCGMGVTILKLKDGVATNAVVAGKDAYTLFGTDTLNGIVNWGIRDMTIDANRQGGAVADCLGVYGWCHDLSGFELKNADGKGWHNEYGSPGAEEHFNVQSWARDGYIWNCDRGGLYYGGPNDSLFTGINIYWNLNTQVQVFGRGTSQFTNCHVWSDQEGGRQSSVGWRFDSPLNTLTSCVGEGSTSFQVWFRSGQNSLIGGEYFYNQNITNTVGGIVLGDSTGQGGGIVSVTGNRIITRVNNCNSGSVIFDLDGGGNYVDVIGNNASASSFGFFGTPGPGSRVRIQVIGAGTNGVQNTEALPYAISAMLTASGGMQLTGLGSASGTVSLGDVDSAGTGFRLVRVPN